MKKVSGQRSEKVSKSATLSTLLFALSFLGAMLFALCQSAEAQPPGRVPRIAYLSGGSFLSGNAEGFRQGLRELGYVEGKNIIVEWRFADGKPALRSEHAAELVRLKVDVIVTSSATDTRAAKIATATIPIVMGQGDDPVKLGFVASLARPGGNITGLATLSPEISGKRLELLKEFPNSSAWPSSGLRGVRAMHKN